MTNTPKPYNPGHCCGADCFAHGLYPNEPCWGDVSVADEIDTGDGDHAWIHECEGHAGSFEGEKYKAQP